MDNFQQDILKVVRSIPSGKVMSYGQVAAYAGAPKATREAGWAMHALGDTPDFPWWRVLNNAGQITISGNADANAQTQQELLEAEGVEFTAPLMLDIELYRHRADREALAGYGLSPESVEDAFEKFGTKQASLL